MSLSEILLERAVFFIPVLLSLTVHEWAHAWTAWKLGDDTARMLGRVSLNPLDHIDPIGTLLLPLAGIPFGWAKPVPINPVRFHKNIRMSTGVLLTAAAGPVSNLLIAALGCVLLITLTKLGAASFIGPEAVAAATDLLRLLVLINVLLACFNLLPIPPLDGGRIVDALVPSSLRPMWNNVSTLGPLLLIGVIFLPALLGHSLLTEPIRIVSELLDRITGV